MNLFQEIGVALKLKGFVQTEIQEAKKMDGTKPGYKTTEFWFTLLGNLINVVGIFKGVIPANVGVIVIAVLTSVYNIVRLFLKKTDTSTVVVTPNPA